MPRGGKRPGAGRPKLNKEYKSIQIPLYIYNLLISKKGDKTWEDFLKN